MTTEAIPLLNLGVLLGIFVQLLLLNIKIARLTERLDGHVIRDDERFEDHHRRLSDVEHPSRPRWPAA